VSKKKRRRSNGEARESENFRDDQDSNRMQTNVLVDQGGGDPGVKSNEDGSSTLLQGRGEGRRAVMAEGGRHKTEQSMEECHWGSQASLESG